MADGHDGGTSATSGGGLLLDFPSARRRGRAGIDRPAAVDVAPRRAAISPDRENARDLLQESMAKAKGRLQSPRRLRHAASSTEASELRNAVDRASQVMGTEGASTNDMLRALADVEAAAHVLLASETVEQSSMSSSTPDIVPAWRRASADTSSSSTSGVGTNAAPTRSPGNTTSGRRSFSVPPPQTSGMRTVGSHLLDVMARNEETISIPEHAKDDIEVGTRGAQIPRWAAESGGIQAVCEWTPEAWADICRATDTQRMAQLALDAQALGEAYSRVAVLMQEQGEQLDASTEYVQEIKTNSVEATKNIAMSSKRSVRGLTLKASLGGLVVGGTGGFCVAGPVGAVVGAGASAALGAVGGSTMKRRHRKMVDRLVDPTAGDPVAPPAADARTATG